MPSNEILDPPSGCIEIKGFLLVIEPGKLWLRKDLTVTDVWSERGVWATQEEADAAMQSLPD